jgi:outer membrane receptor protein involved in Fe transport
MTHGSGNAMTRSGMTPICNDTEDRGNLFHKEAGARVTLRFSITNLTNKLALYNFLSTFSGTHFVPPRTYQASVGYAF